MTLAEALRGARARLREAGLPEADLDARLLLGWACELDATGLFLRERDVIEPAAAARLEAALARRAAGEPAHRIIGRRAFFDHEFELSRETLEPRPDTETLVHLASRALSERPVAPRFADVGTGTGVLAVSLLALHPGAFCVATDLSEGALATARHNARAARVADRFLALRADFLTCFAPMSLDFVVSNPPYIPTGDLPSLSREVREHDPLLALDGGLDGLAAYRAIIGEAARVLTPSGDILVEIGIGQAEDVAAIGQSHGFGLVAAEADLGGIVRALRLSRTAHESHKHGENRTQTIG
ncbi:release factor glutamine methyltransferase [Aureimonas jatrophae]|nr:peptide chain release factor N(5)-glutamine methyltransferase [Aureimonas jatrophae]MBB3952037.1 release factor glutamine methyltransferase [Aureimonas jatrophae]